jgi:hypothetical protein
MYTHTHTHTYACIYVLKQQQQYVSAYTIKVRIFHCTHDSTATITHERKLKLLARVKILHMMKCPCAEISFIINNNVEVPQNRMM